MEEKQMRRLVMGQHVTEEKKLLARRMRRNMTDAEAALWSHLRGGALGVHFRRQQNIAGFIADFYCHTAALAVEVDGFGHDAAYDAARDAVFTGQGLTTLRFTNRQVLEETDEVLAEIERYLPPAHLPPAQVPTPPATGRVGKKW